MYVEGGVWLMARGNGSQVSASLLSLSSAGAHDRLTRQPEAMMYSPAVQLASKAWPCQGVCCRQVHQHEA
jgi:hypothetical protein